MSELEGKVALVTGAASGIGKACADMLAARGASVGYLDLAAEGARACAERCAGEAIGIGVNVCDEIAVASAVDHVVRRFGSLDIAVNAAGRGMSKHLLDQGHDEILSILDLNVAGLLTCCKYEARAMIAGGGGSIVNISSVNARQAGEGLTAYCASKAAVSMATQVAALELGPSNVRVTAVGPAVTATPYMVEKYLADPVQRNAWVKNIPLGRPAAVEEIAEAVFFLASSRSSFVSGDTLYVDGGALARSYPDDSERRAG